MNRTAPPTAAENLRAAASIIEIALVQLDATYSTCDRCQSRHFHDLTQARVYERLTDTPEKLRSMADKLDGFRDGNRL